jgi:hypothetical protein
VHNIRIERLWVDVTAGFGRKWKHFFLDLEHHDGLDVESDAHIWLVKHLFLREINADAEEWAGAWNNHKLGLQGNRSSSPNELYFFGMIQEGPRGIGPVDDHHLTESNLRQYGVDWEALEDQQVHSHHDEANGIIHHTVDDSDYLFQCAPERLPHVHVEEPWCPLSDFQVSFLDTQLNWDVRDIGSYQLRWITALDICTQLMT